MKRAFFYGILVFVVLGMAPGMKAGGFVQTPPAEETQPEIGRVAYEVINLDLERGILDKTLPFDVPFFICGRIPGKNTGTYYKIALTISGGDRDGYLKAKENFDKRDKEVRALEESDPYNQLPEKTKAHETAKKEFSKAKEGFFVHTDTWESHSFTNPDSASDTAYDFCLEIPPLPPHQTFTITLDLTTGLTPDNRNSIKNTIQAKLAPSPNLYKTGFFDAGTIQGVLDSAAEAELFKFPGEGCRGYTLDYCWLNKSGSENTDFESFYSSFELDFPLLNGTNNWTDYSNNASATDQVVNQNRSGLTAFVNWLLRGSSGNAQLGYLARMLPNTAEFDEISKGTTTLAAFPAAVGSFPKNRWYKKEQFRKAAENIASSRQDLFLLITFVETLLNSPSNRAQTYYPGQDKNAISPGVFTFHSFPSGQKDLTIAEADGVVIPRLNQLLLFLRTYDVYLSAVRNVLVNMDEATTDYENRVTELADAFLAVISGEIKIPVKISGLTSEDFVSRGKYFITADLGFAAIPQIHSITPYVGVNFNLAALNREADYGIFRAKKSDFERNGWRKFLQNTSVVIGITFFDVAKNSNELQNLWAQENVSGTTSSKLNLLTGVGFRVSDGVRVSLGSIWMREAADLNPLNSVNPLRPQLYTSVSLDLDLREYAKGIFDLFKSSPVNAFTN